NLAADKTVEFIDALVSDLGIPAEFKPEEVNKSLLPELVRGSRGSSMKGNPRELSDDEIKDVLMAMM
ncbi:hypothetical protein JXO59_09250, partial [candidate division KSB1 bacterium]|nr:hypothetical protein [candidate division KSB1 bacterium]